MAKFGIGQPLNRVEDARLLTGQGRYTADIDLPGQAWGHALRSPHAHARITAIDPQVALGMPGVPAIYTAAEIRHAGIGAIKCLAPVTQPDGSVQPLPPHPVLAEGKVRHVGDPVAVMNAVLDALSGRGVTAIDMPATPQAVWRAIKDAA